MRERLTRIADKLAAVARDPVHHATFGADRHRFALDPPLSEADVTAFENARGVRLPEAYRAFVTGLGDGGAGPFYGVQPLREAFEDAGDDGALAVVHCGCAFYVMLAVAGPDRGRLVSVDLDGVVAPYTLEDADFLAWYERWLDGLAAGHTVARMADTLPGDEADLLAIGATGPDTERRARAVHSLIALPALTPAGAAAVAGLVADPSPRVRDHALRVLGRFVPAQGLAPARAALDDDEPDVRLAALRAVRQFDPRDLAAIARRMLGDPSTEVVSSALFALEHTGETTVADLLPLTTSAEPGNRISALYHLRHAHGDPTAPLAAALDDADPFVRIAAIQTILRRKVDGLRPRLVALRAVETHPTVLSNLRHVTP